MREVIWPAPLEPVEDSGIPRTKKPLFPKTLHAEGDDIFKYLDFMTLVEAY
jgi:hypothetical protein